MASNIALISVKNRGWLNGYGNIFSKENHQWWGTWRWLIQTLIWLVIVNGVLSAAVLINPGMRTARQEVVRAQLQAEGKIVDSPVPPVSQTALMIFFIFSGMAPAVGVVILGQDAIIQERQSGTAAWVLSKPVSRTAYILSKFSADALGILVTMVLVQGIVAFLIYHAAVGQTLPVLNYLASLGLLYLLLLFYLALTFMLGTLFRNRGPVIGLPMVLIFGNQLTGLVPWLGKVLPWNLVIDLPGQPALAVALANGQPLPTVTPIIGTTLLTLVFMVVTLVRYQREEF
jgi:ABC-2 type transport system permease protein